MNQLLRLESYQKPDQFGQLIGYQVCGFDRQGKEARVGLEVADKHLSPSGKAHGGVLSALLDYACGVAVCTTLGEKDLCSTVELKVNYLRPVELGDRLIAVAKVAFRGNKLCVLNAQLNRHGENEPVALASSTYHIVERGKTPD